MVLVVVEEGVATMTIDAAVAGVTVNVVDVPARAVPVFVVRMIGTFGTGLLKVSSATTAIDLNVVPAVVFAGCVAKLSFVAVPAVTVNGVDSPFASPAETAISL